MGPLVEGGALLLDRDREFCKAMLPRVSRTFAASIEILPSALCEPVRCGYLLCRIVDTVEDSSAIPHRDRLKLFSAFDEVVARDSTSVSAFSDIFLDLQPDDSSDASLCRESYRVFRVFRSLPAHQRDIMRTPILTMSGGMRDYCQRQYEEGSLVMRDIADLERYCYFVAGTVGELLTGLFLGECPLAGPNLATVRQHEVRFGIGLQLVNIVKDIAEDASRGVSFVPVDLLHAHGINPVDLLDPHHRFVALKVLRILTAVARGHLDAAREYTAAWPPDLALAIRLFLVVPLALAYRTLDLVEEGGSDVLVLGRNPKVPRECVLRILADAPKVAGSNDALVRFLSVHSQF